MTASISDYGLDRDWTADVVGYPDPAIEVCDRRFERYRVLPAAIQRLWTGGRWTEDRPGSAMPGACCSAIFPTSALSAGRR
jgi:hypothetical protein